MGMIQEFKEFALKGNVVDMAVGIVIGAAFGTIVKSFVEDIIMPPIGLLTGGIDFSDQAITLKAAEGDEPAVLLTYGNFINALLSFLIIAFAIFMVIKLMNNMRRKEEDTPSEPPKPSKEVQLLTEIRDALASKP